MEVMKVDFSGVLMMCYSGIVARVFPYAAIIVRVCTAADVTN